jgi:transcriptional regulator
MFQTAPISPGRIMRLMSPCILPDRTLYIPPSNSENRPEVLFDFIEAHPFAALVTAGPEGLFATHLPFVLDRSRGTSGFLQGHIARANPHHRLLLTSAEALVIFSGPDAYISPGWYPAKAEHGKVVPTWNYIAVHVHGAIRFTDEASFLRPHLETLTARNEQFRNHPWSIQDAPAEYISELQRAIVGLEIEITRLEGKWKMSQNRPPADIDGVVQGLSASLDPQDHRVAEIVASRKPSRQ